MNHGFVRPNAHRHYRCQCGRPVFFPNSTCLACGTALGYLVDSGNLVALIADVQQAQAWRPFDDLSASPYFRCANFLRVGCNWMVSGAERDAGQSFCVACRLNRTIPNLDIAGNAALWRLIEAAKRRLLSSLLALRLPVKSRISEDPVRGVMFDFLRAPIGGVPIMTGHLNGLITINIEEADDAIRERIRVAMHEPYRTLLGHLRHEIGHYYWERLVAGTPWLEDFRVLFGDETRDYVGAVQAHYLNGPPSNWQHGFVSSYATAHPFEDWAETWAHYLHMVDTLDTALSFGLNPASVELEIEPFGEDVLYQTGADDDAEYLAIVNESMRLTGVLNELSRSMGQPDFYPFVLSRSGVRKLHFVHRVVRASAVSTYT